MTGLHIGISKRELMEDYYPDEIGAIFEAYSEMHGGKTEESIEPVEMSPEEFLAMDGDWK